jgi:peptidoglycan/xylan/chitin deacetylase (PgdA/CDA1 family)
VQASGGAVALTFHRVLPKSKYKQSYSLPGMVISAETFTALVEHLAVECQVVNPVDAVRDPGQGNGRVKVAITFDDGWRDNAHHAFPVLHRYSLPWIVFLCPGKVGGILPFWPERVGALWGTAQGSGRRAEFLQAVNRYVPGFAREAHTASSLIGAIKRLSSAQRDTLLDELSAIAGFPAEAGPATAEVDATMSWEEIRGLAGVGVEFGSHTVHHQILTQIPAGQARAEVFDSKERVAVALGLPCRAFAYPNGDWSPAVRQMAAEAGYEVAFANRPGIWTLESDCWAVPRCNIWEGAVTGLWGRFSRPHFEYVVFWKSVRSTRGAGKTTGQAVAAPPRLERTSSATRT